MRRALLFCANTCLDKLSWHVNKRALSLSLCQSSDDTVASPQPLPLHLLSFEQLSSSIWCCTILFKIHEQRFFFVCFFLDKTNYVFVIESLRTCVIFRSEEGGWQEVLVAILKACVRLRTSADLRYHKKNIPPSHLYSAVVHMWPSVYQRIKRQRRLLLFFRFRLKWKTASDTRKGDKVGRKRRKGRMMKLWFCLATKGERERETRVLLHSGLRQVAGPQWVLLKINPGWRPKDSFPLSASFSSLFHHPALLPLTTTEPWWQAAEAGEGVASRLLHMWTE